MLKNNTTTAIETKDICASVLSRAQLFASPCTVVHQAPLSMEFSRQEHWSALPFPSPRDLPYPGIKPRYLALQADFLLSEPPGKPFVCEYVCVYTHTHTYIYIYIYISVYKDI